MRRRASGRSARWTRLTAASRRPRALPQPGDPLARKPASGAPGIAALLAAALVTACAPSAERTGPELGRQDRAIYNGSPDNVPAHQAVVHLSVGPALCSGTLIAPRVVLTAAHCVYGLKPSSVEVGFHVGSVDAEIRWVAASRLRVHPDYNPRQLKADIALIRMASDAPAGVTPIPYLPSSLALTASDVGTTLNFSGYGVTESGATGRRLATSDRLDLVCAGTVACSFNGNDAAPNTLCYDQDPGGPCSGDSGGPAFIVRDGKEYVAGVTSYGDPNCRYFGCSTKVDAYEAFIASVVDSLAQADGTACSADLDCDSGACVDGVCCDRSCSKPCNACAKALGAVADGRCTPVAGSCDDGNLCTVGESCQNGVCRGTSVSCPAATGCFQASRCDPATGACLAAEPKADGVSCSDGDDCTADDRCLAGACVGTSQDLCPAPDACHEAAACDHATGRCAPFAPKADGTRCNDGDPCTVGDACAAGVCKGSPKICPANACRFPATCDPSTGACLEGEPKADGLPCNDKNACSVGDHCEAGTCVGTGGPATCPPPGTCYEAGSCEAETLRCVAPKRPNGTLCDDLDPCTTGDRCADGACAGEPVRCPATECRAEGVCDPAARGCVATAVEDGTACAGGTCQAGTCIQSGCGCTSAGAEALPAFALAALALLGRRRRR